MSNHRINYPPLPAERNIYEAADKAEALRKRIVPNAELAGRFYWPRDDYSTPADNLCWHIPPSPDADYRCVRHIGHAGKHGYVWSPRIKDHSHKNTPERSGTAREAPSDNQGVQPAARLPHLDAIADVVLAYRPKAKTKPARKRQRARRKREKAL